MENAEPRKRSVPGAREIVMQIKSLSESIQSMENEIKGCMDKISVIIEEGRANSKKSGLLAEFRGVSEEIRHLRSQKKDYFDQLKSYRDNIDQLKEVSSKNKNTTNVRNPEDIEARIETLNMRLISETISSKEEKQVAADLLALRSMRARLGDIEASRSKIKDIDLSAKECRARIDELSQQLAEKTLAKDRLKAELDKASSTDRVKSPAVVQLEGKITTLKSQKQNLINQKQEKKKAIAVLEAEYAEFEKVLVEQQKLEEKKEKIRKNIQDLRNKKESLYTDISGFDPKIFDTLFFSVSTLKNAKAFSIDINLVDSLIRHGIKIPVSAEEVDETLAMLREKKAGSMSSFRTRNDVANKEIGAINAKIQDETARLNELPPTDFEILKKGGRFRKNQE